MNTRLCKWRAFGVIIAMLLANHSYACRIIYPHPIPMPRPHPMPVVTNPIQTKSHSAEITIDGQLATVNVDAVFYNPNSFQVEGTYFFPLPAAVAVKSFSMFMNGKEMKGELLDATRARAIYEDIVRKMKDPGLLEFVGMQMLKMRVFPIPANGDVRIKLSYNHLVSKDSGMNSFFYPLSSAKPADDKPIGQVTLKVNLKSPVAIKNIYSPTHTIDKNMKDDFTAVIGYEGKNVMPSRDFTLYWAQKEDDIGVSLLTHENAGEKYFMLLLSPKVAVDESRVIPKDIVFVLDTSGSMQEGGKIAQAKRALTFCLSKLRPVDTFNLVAFSTDTRNFQNAPVEATPENIASAQAYVDKLDAAGGTAIDNALEEGLKQLSSAKSLPMLLFLTDGLPTVGETNIDIILKNAKSRNSGKTRIFAFGVGYDVNTKLLDRLADEGRGMREYVKPKEDIEVKVSNIYAKISHPVLSDISVDYGGIQVTDSYPKQVPDIFRGTQRIILGRFSGEGNHTIRVKGKVLGSEKEFIYEAAWGEKKAKEFLPTLWAMRKVGYLLDAIRTNGTNQELVNEITRLGKRYGIVTPYTSFLVVEDKAVTPVIRESAVRQMEQETRKGFIGGKESGRAAVDKSEATSGLKRSLNMDAAEEKDGSFGYMPTAPRGAAGGGATSPVMTRMKIKRWYGKTFYLTDGVWTDSAVTAEAAGGVVKVTFMSDEYFRLIQKNPTLAKLLSIGDNIVVEWNGTVYKIEK